MFPLHPICEPDNYYYQGSTQLWVHPSTSFDKDVLVEGVNSCIVFNAAQKSGGWVMNADIMQVDVSGSISTPRTLYSETFQGIKSTYAPSCLRQGWI
jgi:hypothetical protein